MDTALPVAFIIMGVFLIIFKGLMGVKLSSTDKTQKESGKLRSILLIVGIVFTILGVLELMGIIDFLNEIAKFIWNDY